MIGSQSSKVISQESDMDMRQDTHSKAIGYLLWIFGFLGSHRFYYGKPVTGTIWFFTLGLFFIGWIIDLFLIPSMDREADLRFTAGDTDYNVAWILLTFLGIFGVHRMYQGKWITGIIYLFKPQLDTCRFAPCSHTHEPDCAVKAAVEAGTITQERYDAYVNIYEEIKSNQQLARKKEYK